MRRVFAGLAILLLLIVLAEFYFSAAGAASSAPRAEAYRPHHALGYVIFFVPVVMIVVAVLARMPLRFVGLPALIAGLTAVQVLITEVTKGLGDTFGSVIFGLHAVNGVVILAVAAVIVGSARTVAVSPAAADIAQPANRG
ncbi:DUF6220 domain-containing protein [Micromonospora andamanensis]|uniref:Uncharacterized protein n=1 Tax=Micromonospora andamanensis TaxID=1287068 RepID=A0ABQ4HXC5_9ACTN|nr:DUF6220 domain-containing protein [Micromonospora andamanensis]GIJ10297.1 hypothetical protein Van01_35110 [Micromonospora andamanensis]